MPAALLVLAEQIAAIDPERLGHLVGHISQQEVADVDHALQVVLQLG